MVTNYVVFKYFSELLNGLISSYKPRYTEDVT